MYRQARAMGRSEPCAAVVLAEADEGAGVLMEKKPSEWNEEDLNALVTNHIGEDVGLEYKACASLEKTEDRKDEVSRDVSSFANSAGGTIVYGMLEDGGTHLPSGIDGGYDPSEISKDW